MSDDDDKVDEAEGMTHNYRAVLQETLDQRDALQARIDAVKALHESCELMGVHGERTGIYTCSECGDDDVPWPCETVRILDGDA
jgi:hypothetical protein